MVKRKYTVLIISIVILLVVGMSYWFISLDREDQERMAIYQKQSLRVGIHKAREECFKEIGELSTCSTITEQTSSVSATECSGRSCWMIYATTDDSSFGASVTVVKDGDKYVVSDYLRDPGMVK